MITHLLDTSVYSQRLRRDPVASVVRRWSELGDARVATACICEAEVLFGLNKRNSSRLWLEYNTFLKNRVILLPLDRKVIETYAEIKAVMQTSGRIVGEFDLLIGATALANHLRLATLNVKDFEKIPGLLVEDWS